MDTVVSESSASDSESDESIFEDFTGETFSINPVSLVLIRNRTSVKNQRCREVIREHQSLTALFEEMETYRDEHGPPFTLTRGSLIEFFAALVEATHGQFISMDELIGSPEFSDMTEDFASKINGRTVGESILKDTLIMYIQYSQETGPRREALAAEAAELGLEKLHAQLILDPE